MILNQQFIELGEGFGDIYELCELINTNSSRLHRTFILAAPTPSGHALSLAVALEPANEGFFMPVYICREGIIQNDATKSKRRLLFEEAAEKAGSIPVYIEVKHSTEFAERVLFFQYVTGILRLNHLLPPLR
ncbi:DUF7147 family protein [Sporosarcina sp. FSL K6-3457]|uniref:DUF7147 family protein n=1 Tax=Sporosarcina sp. FSL K6-3457 TaxID=2978204 RepID=UPI0030F6CE06